MCKYCDPVGGEWRRTLQNENGYMCSREKGHPGPHVACGAHHAIAVWDSTPPAFNVVIVTNPDGSRHAVGCTAQTVQFVQDNHPGAKFEVLPLEEHWSIVVDRATDFNSKAEAE